MINEYATDIASQMGVELSEVLLTDGVPLGCQDSYILDMVASNRIVSTIVLKSDIEDLENNYNSTRLEVRIRSALSRLQ